MKYIFKNDLLNIKNEKMLYFYFLIFSIISIVSVLSSNSTPFYYKSLGIKIDSIYNVIEIIIYLFNILFYILIQLKILLKEASLEQYLLRSSTKKWIISKIFTVSIVTIIIRFLCYMLIIMYSIIFKISINSIGLLIICDLSCLLLIQNLFLLNYMLFKAKKITMIISLGLLMFCIIKKILIPFNIMMKNQDLLIVIILTLVTILLNIIIGKRDYKYVFERSN